MCLITVFIPIPTWAILNESQNHHYNTEASSVASIKIQFMDYCSTRSQPQSAHRKDRTHLTASHYFLLNSIAQHGLLSLAVCTALLLSPPFTYPAHHCSVSMPPQTLNLICSCEGRVKLPQFTDRTKGQELPCWEIKAQFLPPSFRCSPDVRSS